MFAWLVLLMFLSFYISCCWEFLVKMFTNCFPDLSFFCAGVSMDTNVFDLGVALTVYSGIPLTGSIPLFFLTVALLLFFVAGSHAVCLLFSLSRSPLSSMLSYQVLAYMFLHVRAHGAVLVITFCIPFTLLSVFPFLVRP